MGEGMTKRPRAILLALVMLLSTVAVPSVADQPGNLSNDPFSDFDSDISGLLSDWQIPGAQVAVMYNGSLVFNKGYGITANGTDENGTYWSSPVTVDSKFRIASLSKAVTAAGILTLIEDGSISLDDKMVDLVPDLIPTEFEGCDYPNHSTSYSINDINVSLLLNHRAGFDPNSDPTYWHWKTWVSTWQDDECIDKNSLIEDFDSGNLAPIPMERILTEWLRRPLDYNPGSRYEYSNIGYQILGQIIEAQTGMEYEDYIIDNVLTPMGIESMSIGMTMPDQRAEDEASYFDDGNGFCHFPSGQDENGDPIFPISPDPDCGAFVVEEKDGGGGWIATASDYAKFISHIDGTIQNGLFEDPFDYFIENPYDSWGSWYGSGVFILGGDTDVWQHWGAFSGSSTNFRREVTETGEPVIFVMFTNTRPSGTWQNTRESVISQAMMEVDYENATSLDSDEQEWEWPEPLPPQDDAILGDSTLILASPFDASSNISADWNANITMREDYGIDLLPNRELGVRVQIDQHLGNGDGNLSLSEISVFVDMIRSARNLPDSETIGCCVIDYSALTPVRGLDITVYPPAEGPVTPNNGSWGWTEFAELTGTTDSRSTRILDIPRVGGVIEEIPLRVLLPSPWEFRYSAMQSVIEGSPNDFTVFRHQAPVSSDIRITLGENSPPSTVASRQTGNTFIPLDIPTHYTGECIDSALDQTTQWWTVHNNGTMMLSVDGDNLEFTASELNFTHGQVASVVMHCMDSFSSSSNWNENILIDGESPTWEALFEIQIDGETIELDSDKAIIEVPSGSEFYFRFNAHDSGSLPVEIEVTSDKSENWRHSSFDQLEFMDRFFQGDQINGMHLNLTERHEAKLPSEYSVSLSVTDDASNTVTNEWTIIVTDSFGPTIIPEIFANDTPISPGSPARAGDSIVLSLTQSFDDLDAIDDVFWEIRMNEQVLAEQAIWRDVEKTTLPITDAGTYILHVIATDSSNNMEQITWGLAVSPRLGVNISVLDIVIIGDLVEGETINIVITMENTGGDVGLGMLCSASTCSEEVLVAAANSGGSGIFVAELHLDLISSNNFDLRFDWSSDQAESNGSLVIDHDFIIEPAWQMPLQVLLAVLVLLMFLAWLAHRTWGPESLRP
uniref:D-aminoacylase n=1 Tax=uncultured marine group II/III euryarchaeote AD1000_02_G03 TaxID=1457700 RepID=A0A075FGC9_9EURY|nr:D-aminoacylase [uncultured marine group II/III euryarchaeote AD1000_02_G03]